MINTVKSGTTVPDSSLNQKSPNGQGRGRGSRSPAKAAAAYAQSEPDLRLVIEEDPGRGDYVYKLIDRATGAVVAELTRDEVAGMGDKPSYAAGDVVSTKA